MKYPTLSSIGLGLGLAVSAAHAQTPRVDLPSAFPGAERAQQVPSKVTLNTLPHSPEDIYLLLFENNNDGRGADDYIAGAEQAAGYAAPHHWHAEIMYFKQGSGWMVMGCRPPTCTSDVPVSQLLAQFRGYPVRVRHLQIPLEKQVAARQYFMRHFEQKPYDLSGPTRRNCADVPAELATILGIPGVRKFTRDELALSPAVSSFLASQGQTLSTAMTRTDIVFPDALSQIGKDMGLLQQ